MDFDNDAILSQVEELAKQRQWPRLREVLAPLPASYIAAILSELPEDRLPLIYRLLPKELAA